MSRSDRARPEALGSVLSRYMQRKGLDARVEEASVIPAWSELVGQRISEVTSPLRASNGVLFVAVSSSAWMMELNLMRQELMRRINAGKRKGRIEKIVFVMSNPESH